MERSDVIVIGGGAAGLSAARDLSASGLDTLLLEGRNRLGGRIHTLHEATIPMPIELGAEFVHGEAEDVFRLIPGTAVLIDRLPDVHWWSERGRLRERSDFWERVQRILARAGRLKQDVSFAEFLRVSRLSKEDRELVARFVEGYHAADLEKVSSHSLIENDSEQDDDDNPQFRIVTGYDSLLSAIRAGFDHDRAQVRTGESVIAIAWRRGEVEVTTRNSLGAQSTYRGKAVVVTLPIGVLRSDAIAWERRPRGLSSALAKVEMGNVCKIVFRFRERFWAEKDFLRERIVRGSTSAFDMNFIHGSGPAFPTWWTHSPATLPLITAWCGGPAAARMLDLDELQRVDRALQSLTKVFRLDRASIDDQLDGWWTHDWRNDPFSRGAYSYTAVGGSGARRQLARRVEGTVFFAGEGTEESQSGTVAGAIASGKRAASAVMAALA